MLIEITRQLVLLSCLEKIIQIKIKPNGRTIVCLILEKSPGSDGNMCVILFGSDFCAASTNRDKSGPQR